MSRKVKNIKLLITGFPDDYPIVNIKSFLNSKDYLLKFSKTESGIEAILRTERSEEDVIDDIKKSNLDGLSLDAKFISKNDTKTVYGYQCIPMFFEYDDVPIPLEPDDDKLIRSNRRYKPPAKHKPKYHEYSRSHSDYRRSSHRHYHHSYDDYSDYSDSYEEKRNHSKRRSNDYDRHINDRKSNKN